MLTIGKNRCHIGRTHPLKVHKSLILYVLALIPIGYIAFPVGHIFYQASWHSIQSSLRDTDFQRATVTSLTSAAICTLASTAFGLPCAFILARIPSILRRIFEGVFLIPLVLPPVVGGISLLSVFGPTSAIGGWFGSHGIVLSDHLIGVVLAQMFVTSPFLILSAKAAIEQIPQELLEVNSLEGGTLWTQFVYIAIPLGRTAILIGMLLTFARAIGEFGATMMMAYHPYTIPVDLWVQFNSNGLANVIPMAAAIVATAMISLILLGILGSNIRGLSISAKWQNLFRR